MQAQTPDFGEQVLIMDPAMPAAEVQAALDKLFKQQESSQFGTTRKAVLFKPGTYHNKIKLGFYTQLIGLGQLPDDVALKGGIQVEANWHEGDATQNFWRTVENLSVTPDNGTMQWAVSQAAPLRRIHVQGNMLLDDNGGWSSGGFIADSLIDQEINSGTQQQWLTRNSVLGSWTNANWNMVFVGVNNAPSSAQWPNPPYTVVKQTPVVREKPFLTIDGSGKYSVFVPALRSASQGISWQQKKVPGEIITLDHFYIAKASQDNARTMNTALAHGKHLLLTPGIYQLDTPLHISQANSVILGLGIATLQPITGTAAMTIDDVDGVKLAGVLFDAGVKNSEVLLQIGTAKNAVSHAKNPVSLHDVFFRVGGAGIGNATTSVIINSNHVIGDNLWVWRADHGDGIGWETNKTQHGIIVNGDDVTMYGLFVEHFHQYQTLWNGENGAVYFYQSEAPYDVPDQAHWMNQQVNGFASYKVANHVTHHKAVGMGVYCFFNDNPTVKLHSAIEAPMGEYIQFSHITSVSLGGTGEISHVLNQSGDAAKPGNEVVRMVGH
ncbi:adenylyl cyclase [Methylophilus aquaticus]|uniref:Adenylyl cyclase n=1 Tax=Methylophilus aquaticus TaxID=1971610 RepID=A0ABT9JRF1_9PROT|nr:adenylyl cyclase [Methylophilus aquaticus]MDP8567151.1 adenylyl cyclase [Methylophilus aquaticus]